MAGPVTLLRTAALVASLAAQAVAGLAMRAVPGLATLAAPAWAMGPADPFKPPAGARAASGPAAEAQADGDALPGPAATLTGLRHGAAPRALIDGRWLAPGERLGAARLVVIEGSTAVLQHDNGKVQRLSLDAEVRLRPLAIADSAPPPPRQAGTSLSRRLP